MAQLHYNQLAASVAVATTEAGGYPAQNVLNGKILRHWRSTSLAATDLTITLAASSTVNAVFLNDVNFAAPTYAQATIKYSLDGIAYDAGTAITCYADEYGRRRGLLVIARAGVQKIRISIAAGTTTDGLAYFRIGSVRLMGSQFKLAIAPNKGHGAGYVFPQKAQELDNKLIAVAGVAPHFRQFSFDFLRKYTEDISLFKQLVRQGDVVLDMELPQFPDSVWPVVSVDDRHDVRQPKANSQSSSMTVREVVA